MSKQQPSSHRAPFRNPRSTVSHTEAEGDCVKIQSELKDNSKTSPHDGSKGIAGEDGMIRQVWCRARHDQDANFERLTVRDGVETRELLMKCGSQAQRTGYAIVASACHKRPPSGVAARGTSAPPTTRLSARDIIDGRS